MWDWHQQVFTGEPLSFTEMKAWATMTGKQLLVWEAQLLKSIDRIYWSVQNVR